MARSRPKTNFLLTDDDVVPKVEGGALVPPPDSVVLPENPPDPPLPIGDSVETDPGLSGGAPSVIDGLNARAASPDRGNHVHYESRISIVDAWQYPGSLRDAPDWVDKNWAAYGDYDPIREIEAGPALRVPLPSGVTALVRIGDYVARQEVKITRDIADVRLEVWAQEQFEKLFYPVDTRTIEHEVEGAAV